VGADENIIEASWQALVDAVDYYYNNFVVEREARQASG
jgi:2-isopropylmalate synthase